MEDETHASLDRSPTEGANSDSSGAEQEETTKPNLCPSQRVNGRIPLGYRGPDELTPKQEAFVYAYLELGDASAAYRKAYDTTNYRPQTVNRNAWKLANEHEGVKARIELERERRMLRLRAAADVTVEKISLQLDEDRALAHEYGQAGAAVSASKTKAQLHGLLQDGASSPKQILDGLATFIERMDRVIERRSEALQDLSKSDISGE